MTLTFHSDCSLFRDLKCHELNLTEQLNSSEKSHIFFMNPWKRYRVNNVEPSATLKISLSTSLSLTTVLPFLLLYAHTHLILTLLLRKLQYLFFYISQKTYFVTWFLKVTNNPYSIHNSTKCKPKDSCFMIAFGNSK